MKQYELPKRSKCGFKPYKVKSNVLALSMRSGPGKDYPKIGEIVDDSPYTVIGFETGNDSAFGWGFLEEKLAWVSLDYCKRA